VSAEPALEPLASPSAAVAPAAAERHVSVLGQRLFVRERGEGHPLLLINGLGGNMQMWGPTEDRLSGVARTIAFDAPGTGRSRPSPVVLPMPAVARIMCRLLDELGYDRVDVLGYSLGGAMAQQLARSCPDRVRRLALAGTSCGWGSAPPEAAPLALISSPLRYFSPSFYRSTSHVLDGGCRFEDEDLADAQAAARHSHPPSMVGYAQQFLQGITWSSLHWVSTLRMPTLVLAGECDRLVPPANAVLLARRLPAARLHLLPGEGHLMLFDPQSAALPLLEDFFTAEQPGASGAWRTGVEVDDDEVVATALAEAAGAQPFKSLSRAYRAWVAVPGVRAAARRQPRA
jgi:pimeloyl-ACP methyl ester carboxylesterase